MKEIKFAKEIVSDAEKFFTPTDMKFPSMIIDKAEYKEYDMNLLKTELNKLGYNFCEMTQAPEPYSLSPIADTKFFAYKY